MAKKHGKKVKLTALDRFLIIRLLRENFRKHVWLYGAAILSMMAIAATTSASAWIMRDVVNATIQRHNFEDIVFIAIAVAVIFVIKGISSFFQTFFLSRAGNSIVSEQQRKIYRRLMQQGVGFYQKSDPADLMLRVTQNASAARSIIDTVVTTFVRDLLTVTGLLAVMLVQNFKLTIIAFTLGPVAFLCVRLLLKRVRKIMEKELSSLTDIIKVMQETTTGIRVIKAFSLEDKMQARLDKAVHDVQKRANSIATLEAATSPLMETLAGLTIAGVIVLSGYMVTQEHAVGVEAQLMAFITALLLAYEPAKRLANVRVKIESGMMGVRMMYELIDRPISLMEKENPEPLACPDGEIAFEEVSFAYNAGHPVLHNISLNFPAGKMTALVGPSGSGKSTMINLMMRLYDPDSGAVKIDGQDIKTVSFKTLRENISYVGQDTFLFDGTVYDNIALGRPGATETEVIAAARAANADEFIREFDDGYQSNVGDNGGHLSGGQKQRISIARAMLRDSKILILDEATSALDSRSESLIQEALKRLTKGRTTIVIAHRLSTIAHADKIVVMKEGDVHEQGTEKELLAMEKGLYRELYQLQFQNARQNLEYADD